MYCRHDVPNYRKTTYPPNSKLQILPGKASHTATDMSVINITLWNSASKCTYKQTDYMLWRYSFYLSIYKACSKKNRTFAIRLHCSFYSILSTVPFKVVPSAGVTPFPTFLPLLECFLERTSCDGVQFSYRIFLNFLYGLEMTSFQCSFKFGKQEKVCWG